MAVLTRDALLALKPKIEAVAVPEAGEGAELCVCELDALSVFEFTAAFRDLAKKGDEGALDPKMAQTINSILERSIVDQTGKPLFGEGEFGAVRLSLTVRQRLLDKALELSGMKDPETAAEQEESPRKNPGPTRTSDSLAA